MEQKNLLGLFEYALMPASSHVAIAESANYCVPMHLPLLHVCIDFDKGELFLEGDWPFLVASNRHSSSSWLAYHAGTVSVQATIKPAGNIDLDDDLNDGLIFPVEGIISDRNNINLCSGMIILDKIRSNKKNSHHGWDISLYLYDLQVENCEIKYRLPVYTNKETEKLN